MADIREEFAYLNRLRESGVTNMFGASPYLMREFGLSKREARQILGEWMEAVQKDPSILDM